MRVILFVISLFSLVTTYSQKDEDSILRNIPENKHDSLYYELFKKYRQSDPSLALTYAQKCFDRARALKHQMLEIKSENAIGWLQQNAGDFENAIETHTNALKLAKEYKMEDRVMYSYNNLGIIYDKLDIYDKALDNYFKGLELARKLKVLDVEISTLNNIGVSYGKLKNPTEALNYYSQAHDLEIKNGDDGLNATYVNMGLTYIDVDDLVKAKEVFQQIVKKKEIDPVIKIASLRGLARCYLLSNETQKCIYFANQALTLAKEKQLRDQESDAYHLIASARLKENDFIGALDNCEKAIEIAKILKSHSNLQQTYELESRVYEKLGDYRKSKDALTLSVAYKDSIFNQQFTENFKNIHLKLEQEKSSSIIIAKDQKIAQQERFSLIAMISGTFMLVITGLSIYFFRVVRKKNKQISTHNTDLENRVSERTAELSNTAQKLTDVIKELDTYIYRTSHDIKGPLVRLKGLVELALRDRKNSEDYLDRLVGVIDNLNDIVNRVILISKIHNHVIKKNEVSLEELFDQAILTQTKNINFDSVKISKLLKVKSIKSDPEILAIAINNIISNAYRYVNNRREPVLIIESNMISDQVVISIKDNGVGFDPRLKDRAFELFVHGEGDTGVGLGLHLSKLAIEKTGGKISLIDGELTHLQIEVPV